MLKTMPKGRPLLRHQSQLQGRAPRTPSPVLASRPSGLSSPIPGGMRAPQRRPVGRKVGSPRPRRLFSLDSETTGIDFLHGCKPFMFSACDYNAGEILTWEWDVDPLTREPIIPEADKAELRALVAYNDFIFHNAKFDVRALESIDIIDVDMAAALLDQCHDTQIGAHVLASAEQLGLKDGSVLYLDIDEEDESELQVAVNKARAIGRKLGWRVAKEGDPHFPALKASQKIKWWAMDMWLPRAVAKHLNYPKDHPWWTICRRYNLKDVERTCGLRMYQEALLEQDGLEDQYARRLKLLKITYEMENHGASISKKESDLARKDYETKAKVSEAACKKIAGPTLTNLGSADQVRTVLFDKLKLPTCKKTKTGANFSVDKDVLDELKLIATPGSKAESFLTNLQDNRAYTKALDYMDSYGKYGVQAKASPFYWMLHPNFNITGTRTTRFSSNWPNMQNVSKKEKINLRRIFGPMRNREWWCFDYSNIEMRIFAYASGDASLIQAFESGKSVHLIFAEILFPKEYLRCLEEGKEFKDEYDDTLYQWTKNGNFALIYGAGIKKANATYHVPDAYQRIRDRLPLIDQFMRQKDYEARSQGYVTTLGGYRLQVPEKKPHCAVNYYVQGSAGICMINAMIRVYEYLQSLPEYHMIMTIHDELDFDFPQSPRNLEIAYRIKQLMEMSGDDIEIPTPVDCKRTLTNWATTERIKDFKLAI